MRNMEQAKAAMPYLAKALSAVMEETGGEKPAYPLIPTSGG